MGRYTLGGASGYIKGFDSTPIPHQSIEGIGALAIPKYAGENTGIVTLLISIHVIILLHMSW